jgi:hypothetical protein
MSNTDLDDKDQLVRAMKKDLDRILADESVNIDSQTEKTRGAMTTVLTESVRTQRLYFVVRSMIMSLISALIYFLVVLYLGAIGAIQAAFLGIFVFVAALVVSRLLDKQVVIASTKSICSEKILKPPFLSLKTIFLFLQIDEKESEYHEKRVFCIVRLI